MMIRFMQLGFEGNDRISHYFVHKVVADEKVAKKPEHEVDRDVEVGETTWTMLNDKRCDGCHMDKSVDYMDHICGYFADCGADVGGEGCGSMVPAARDVVAHAPAMRRLRQEAGDVEETPLPEHEVIEDENVAEKPEHEVDDDVEVAV